MPQATPQLVHLRSWKRSLAHMRSTAEAAAGNTSSDSLVETALALLEASDLAVDVARQIEIARITYMERHKGKKKKKGGSKQKK
jgi:hypothetical protein